MSHIFRKTLAGALAAGAFGGAVGNQLILDHDRNEEIETSNTNINSRLTTEAQTLQGKCFYIQKGDPSLSTVNILDLVFLPGS